MDPSQETMPATFTAATDTGKRRRTNEDAAVAVELGDGAVLLAVADGAGGMGGGDVASTTTIRALLDVCLGASETSASASELLRNAAEAAHTRVRAAANAGPHPAMASTLVAAIVQGEHAWLANIGDSRAYLYRDGTLQQLTEDDSWVAEQVRANRMTEEQARSSPQRNVITRAIGAGEVAPVEPIEVELQSGDVLLLCSDGLHGVLDDEVIADVLADRPLEDAAAALIAAANDRGGPDNIAVAIYRDPASQD